MPECGALVKDQIKLDEEMDAVAAEVRRQPKFVEEDLRIAFRKIQLRRLPNFPAEEFDALYGAWKGRHDRRRELEPKLLECRDRLFEVREVAREPEERAVLTDVLHALTTEIAALLEPRDGRTPMPGDATWG